MNIRWLQGITVSLFLLFLLLFLQGGCAKQETSPQSGSRASEISFSPQRQQEKTYLNFPGEDARADSVQASSPRFKPLNPLDTERVNISVAGEPYDRVLQLLAHVAALNLIISPETSALLGTDTLLTAEYQDMTVRQVLDSVCSMLNIVWSEESGSLFIKPFLRKSLDLDFLGSIRRSNFEVGGDVLGSQASGSQGNNSSAGNSPLSGRFIVQGEATETVTDIYANLEASLEELLGDAGSFVLNRQTGHLLVRARPATIQEIEEYIEGLREKYRRQVLIEAKIIEVGLNKKHELGIDWRAVGAFISKSPLRLAGEAVATITPHMGPDQSFYSLTINSKYSDINGIFHALEEYGELTILSNPRLKAMNGQPAVMSVGQSVAYLASFQQTSEGTGDNRTVDYSTEIGSVFDGVLLGLTPIIEQNDMISLHIVPIKSDLVDLEQVSFGPTFSTYQITLPRVNLREISTVTRVHSGDIVLLGGLIMDYDEVDDNGLPVLQDIPLLGRLFEYRSTEKKHVELVIALHVQVVDY